MANFSFEIVETLGVAPAGGSMALELNLVKWGNRKAVLDLRKWDDTHTTMGKGFTLSRAELESLRDMLNRVFEEEEEEED